METVTIKLETYNRLKDELESALSSYQYLENVYGGRLYATDKNFVNSKLEDEIKRLKELINNQSEQLKNKNKSLLQRLFY